MTERFGDLTPQQFRHALHAGLGRARVFARLSPGRFEEPAYRDILLDAFLYCRTIDPQCEGTGGPFVLDIVQELPDRSVYYDALLRALGEDRDTWHSSHRFFLAYCLVDEDPRARESLYRSFNPGPLHGEMMACYLVDMDKEKGLIFAAEKLGELLESRPPRRLDTGWLMSDAAEQLGETEAWDILRTAARTNAHVATYLEHAEEAEREWRRLNPTDRPIIPKALDPLPTDPAPLVAQLDGSDRYTRSVAMKTLQKMHHPEVRALALEWINTQSPWRHCAIDLLIPNFEPGDHALALSWYRAETDADALHDYVSGLRRLWQAHPDAATHFEMLLEVYERGSCAMLREFVIRDLLKMNALTPELREECAWDASEEIRELVSAPGPSQ